MVLQRLYDARDFDFRLRSGAAAIDRGLALPTVTPTGLQDERRTLARWNQERRCRPTARAVERVETH
jgi:hypothetical protein